MNRHDQPAHADTDGYIGYSREYDRPRSSTASRNRGTSRASGATPAAAAEKRGGFTLDAGSLLRPASRRWYWVLIGGILGAAAGAALGLYFWKTEYSATAQMVRIDPPMASDAYRPQPLNGPTLVAMIKSPEIFTRVAPRMDPPTPANVLASRIGLGLERNSEVVNVTARGPNPQAAVALANHYNRAVIEFTQEHQRREASEADVNIAQMLKDTEADLAEARKQLPAGVATALNSAAAAPFVSPKKLEQIEAAKNDLSLLLAKFTDAHWEVKRQREVLARLMAELPPGVDLERLAAGSITDATGASSLSREQLESAAYNLRTLENLRMQIIARQRQIQVFKQNPPGSFRVMQEASDATVVTHEPWLKVGIAAAFFGILGLVFSSGEILRRELFDNRLKTEDDVTRVTGLPVLGNLGDLRQMSLSAREAWAFRTWIALQDRLAYSPNHGLICGITSSNSGDGRSTWIGLLAGAARKCGFRVLTIATRSTADLPATAEQPATEAAEPVVVGAGSTSEAEARVNGTNGHAITRANGHASGITSDADRTTAYLSNPLEFGKGARAFSSDSEFTALTASALFTPAMVTEKLMGPESDPLVHIPLPGWTWNLERRKQWQGALNVWRKIDNVVILVELPPASMPESVLLASNLPNLAWLVESGKSDAAETRAQLQTLRHARCNLVGAFINRALTPMSQGKLSRWVGCFAMFALLGLVSNAGFAADAAPASASGQVSPAATAAAFSVVSPAQRAPWQQKLTLGPGDVLSLSLLGEEKELTRREITIGPDGRVSYLEAQNVMAAGLTVDEFRDRLNEELGKFRRAAQAYVIPVSYNSKKYYVLGKVAQRGAFPLDRPRTLIEAVALARGLETGLSADRNVVELADLSRAFIARDGRKLPVDFERLFLEGDLTQNVPLEPNDYIYFPSTGESEVFVLGAVRQPGAYTYSSSIGALSAIAARGGFTDRAWKQKLLVIRGSLGRPETFVVDAKEVLGARTPDLKLQPRDIVYVSERPWIRAEELLDAAASAFVTSAVVSWTGLHVTPIERRP